MGRLVLLRYSTLSPSLSQPCPNTGWHRIAADAFRQNRLRSLACWSHMLYQLQCREFGLDSRMWSVTKIRVSSRELTERRKHRRKGG